MKIVFSAEDLAGEGLASADELKSIKTRFQEGVTSTFLLRPKDSRDQFSAEELCQIRSWFSVMRVSEPELKMAMSTFDFKWPVALTESKTQYRNVLDLNCEKKILNTPLELVQQQLNTSPFGLALDRGSRLSLVFQFVFYDSETSRFGSFDPERLASIRKSVYDELLPLLKESEVHWIGPADYQWYVLEGFKYSKWVNLGMMLLILLGMRFFLGTWKSGFIYCSSVIVTAMWVFGLKGLVGSSFDILSTGLLLMIGISSLEDFIFVSGEMMKGRTWQASSRKILTAGFFTSLSTIVGFLALCVSDMEAIQRMGLWSAIGALIEWLVLFIALPAFLKTISYKKVWVQKNARFDRFTGITGFSWPRPLAWLACSVFPLGLLLMDRLDYNEAPYKVFPEGQEFRESVNHLKKNKEWLGVTSLLFDQPLKPQEAQAVIQKIQADPWINDFVVAIESSQSIVNWLESQKALPTEVAQVQFNISNLRDVYVDDQDFQRALVYVRETSVADVRTLTEKVKSICRDLCHLGGEVVAYADFSGKVVHKSLIDSLGASLVLVSLVILFIALAVDQVRMIFPLLLSAFWGPFLMISLLGAFHATIDFWKSIFASILVGLAGDNAIHYLEGSRHRSLHSGIEDRGASSILTALMMSTTALVYLGSYFSSPRVFGLILWAGVLASLVGELWLLNSLLTSKVTDIKEEVSRGQVVTNSTGRV